MKKLLISVIGLIAICISPAIVMAGTAINNIFTETVSSVAATTAGYTPDINLSVVNVKNIDVTNTTATAQTVTVYKNSNSTTTMTAVYVFAVPAAIGTYQVPLFNFIRNSVWSSAADYVNIPYLSVRTSTATASNAASVNIIYWK